MVVRLLGLQCFPVTITTGTYNKSPVGGIGGPPSGSIAGPPTSTGSVGSGGGHSHNMSATFSGNTANPSILQPYLTIIYIIKT